MKRWSWLFKPVVLIGSLTCLVIFVFSQTQLQVGYAVLTADEGSNVPAGTALFSSTNSEGVLMWEAGVAAVEPISSGRIFVDQQDGSRTALALVNPSQGTITVTLILRDAFGTEVDRKDEEFLAGEHRSLFVDQLFPSSQNFTGSLTFQTQQAEEKVAAVTLRQNTNLQGEAIFATLPVVDLSAEPTTESIILPQVGAGQGLSTQLVLLNSSQAAISGQIQLLDSQGAALELELDGTAGSSFPYQIQPDGTFSGKLTSDSGTAVGYAVITLEEGSQSPVGSAIFQFISGDAVISEAGIAAVTPTTSARIFVDNVGTRTGVAIANAGNPATTLTFKLLDINGSSLQTTTRDLVAGGHLSIFADQLFSEAGEGFTGLMEITSPEAIAPVTLKLTTNARDQSILTTLPLADLTQTVTGSSLIFPQIGFGDFEGGTFVTRLILMDRAQAGGAKGRLNFFQSDGSVLTVPLGIQTGSEFAYLLPARGGRQLRFGEAASGSIAEIIIDPANPLSPEVVVNEGNVIQLDPLALDEEGNILEGVTFNFTSLDTEVATIDAFGEIEGQQAGFSTLTVSAGKVVKTATITVVKVTSGVAGFQITGVVQDLAQRLYLANTRDHTILLAQDLDSVPEVYAGVKASAGLLDDERLKALFRNPTFLALDQARGRLYVSDGANHVIRLVKPGPNGRVETLAGTGEAGSTDGPANEASFNNPQGIALDNRGHLWVADSGNHTVRRINLVTEMVETVAGMAGEAGLADGTREEARFNSPAGIAIDRETLVEKLARQATEAPPPPVTVIVADTNNGVLRRVFEDGQVQTVGLAPLGPQKTTASIQFQTEPVQLNSPRDVAVDPVGNIYVTDPGSGSVKMLLSTGHLVTIGQADTFSSPQGVVITGSGKVVITESESSAQQVVFGSPEIESMTPESISSQAGEVVTIRGRGFASDSLMLIAGQVIENLQILDTQTIVLIAPELPSGKTTVTVQTRGGLVQRSILIEAVPFSALPIGHITTVAGGTTFVGDGSISTQSRLNHPTGVTLDGDGNVFVADTDQHRIRRVDAKTGIITTVAGTGMNGFSGDGGPATAADLEGPEKVAVDSAGNLFITDTGNDRIRKVDAVTGIITTVAGGECCSLEDGVPATEAWLFNPDDVAVDEVGNLFITRLFQHTIRKVDAETGIITTVAGTGERGLSGDGGPATEANLDGPEGVTVDGAGNLLIADTFNNRIRKVNASTGIITTVAGSGATGFLNGGFSGDGGPATAATLEGPVDVAVDSFGNLFIVDRYNDRIRRVDAATGIITTVAGGGEFGFLGDGGPAGQAWVNLPSDVVVDGSGNLYIATGNNRIRKVDAVTGIITTVVGTDAIAFLGDGGPATAAILESPQGVAVDSTGNLYIADPFEGRVRKVDAVTGIITTVAGGRDCCLSGDGGSATEVWLNPYGVFVDSGRNLLIADGLNNRIRRVDAVTGIITTVAGTGERGFSGDGGSATEATLDGPEGVTMDGAGNLFIADTFNHRIRKVDASTGIITTVAGSGPTGILNGGFSGDGGPATAATLKEPEGIAVDSAGNLFIADSRNNRIRRVDAVTGIMTTVPELSIPQGIAVDLADNLLIAEIRVVRKLNTSTGVITIVAGGGTNGLSGDGGPATEAELTFANAVAVDGVGNLFIVDVFTRRIRAVRGPIP